MRIQLPLPNVYLVEFEDSEEMARTFCRIQEFYESPMFRGRYFTLEEFKQYHTGIFGKWDYYTRWGGFNVPGNVFRLFESMFKDLSPDEKKLVEEIRKYEVGQRDKFYVIAAPVDDSGTKNHELHHALFYLDEYYQKKVVEYVKANYAEKVAAWLLENNYSKEVLIDEIAAYLMFDQGVLLHQGFKEVDFQPYIDTTYSLRLNYFKTKAKQEYYMFDHLNKETSERDKAP